MENSHLPAHKTSILGVAILSVIAAGFLMLAWNRFSKPTLTDYEGVIIDRWAGFSNSEQGSRPYFKLLVERDTQERITVNVDAETYRKSEIGMKVISRKGKIELRSPQPKT